MIYPLLTDCVYIQLFSSCFFPQYLHNIPYTKNACFHICISDLRADQISSNYSFLSSSPLFVLHYTWVEATAAYVYDQDRLLLLLFLRLFVHKAFSISFLYHFLFVYISPFACTSVRILHDTCNFTSNVLNYLYRLLSLTIPPLIFKFWLTDLFLFYHRRLFFLLTTKAFLNPRLSRRFSVNNKSRRHKACGLVLF